MAARVRPKGDDPGALRRRRASQTSERVRAFKRRASKACQSCRDRKVRCDVLNRGMPCTNCTLDNVHCMVPESRRSNRPKQVDLQNSQIHDNVRISHSSPSPFRELEEPSSPLPLPDQKHGATSTSTEGPLNELPNLTLGGDFLVHSPLGVTGAPAILLPPSPSGSGAIINNVLDIETTFEPHLIYETEAINETGNAHAGQEVTPSVFASQSVPYPRGVSNAISAASRDFSDDSGHAWDLQPKPYYDLPKYIDPLPARLSDDDITYLSRKGAFAIPPVPFRNALLRSYVEFVHPFLPLIELERLLVIVECDDGKTGRISLLLFQSILFAASAFVPAEYISTAGYSSRKEARKNLFEKARLLYDLDSERDHLTLIQSLILMAYWFERPDDPKSTAHYLCLAISLSHGLGLHRNPNKANCSERQRLRKRIWWCCFMRDRLVSLAISRPVRINLTEMDVPMLTIDDFETLNLPADISCVRNCSYLQDQGIQRQLALSCVEMVKLCVCIGHILTVHNSLANNAQGCAAPSLNVRTKMMLLAPNPESDATLVHKCDEELVKWAAELPDDALYHRPVSTSFDEILTVHKARLLMMYFAATLCALHRPLNPRSTPLLESSHSAETKDLLAKKARLAASEISQLCKDLNELNLVRYLPTSGVTSVLLAAIVHLRNVKIEDLEMRNTSLEQFAHCVTCMQSLRDNYFSADYAIYLLEAAVRKMNHRAGVEIAQVPPVSAQQWSRVGPQPDVMDQNVQAGNDFSELSFADSLASLGAEDHVTRQLEEMFAMMRSDADGSIGNNPPAYYIPYFADLGFPHDTSLMSSNDDFVFPPNLETRDLHSHW